MARDKYKDIDYARACEHEDKFRILINQIKSIDKNIHHAGHEKNISFKQKVIDDTEVQTA